MIEKSGPREGGRSKLLRMSSALRRFHWRTPRVAPGAGGAQLSSMPLTIPVSRPSCMRCRSRPSSPQPCSAVVISWA
jgi:hypothetical protein